MHKTGFKLISLFFVLLLMLSVMFVPATATNSAPSGESKILSDNVMNTGELSAYSAYTSLTTGATVSATGFDSNDGVATAVKDGYRTKDWKTSAWGNEQASVTFDLKKEMYVTQADLWGMHDSTGKSGANRDFEWVKFEGSTDGTTYTELKQVTADPTGVDDGGMYCISGSFTATKVRYVRVTGQKKTGYPQMVFAEIVILGYEVPSTPITPDPDPEPDPIGDSKLISDNASFADRYTGVDKLTTGATYQSANIESDSANTALTDGKLSENQKSSVFGESQATVTFDLQKEMYVTRADVWGLYDPNGTKGDAADFDWIKIEGSTNGTTYTELKKATANPTGVTAGDVYCIAGSFTATKVRYVKLTAQKKADCDVMVFAEIYLFGYADSTVNPDPDPNPEQTPTVGILSNNLKVMNGYEGLENLNTNTTLELQSGGTDLGGFNDTTKNAVLLDGSDTTVTSTGWNFATAHTADMIFDLQKAMYVTQADVRAAYDASHVVGFKVYSSMNKASWSLVGESKQPNLEGVNAGDKYGVTAVLKATKARYVKITLSYGANGNVQIAQVGLLGYPDPKDALAEAISSAGAIDRSLFSAKSLKALDDAVTEGQLVANDETATTTQINEATKKIQTAMDALEYQLVSKIVSGSISLPSDYDSFESVATGAGYTIVDELLELDTECSALTDGQISVNGKTSKWGESSVSVIFDMGEEMLMTRADVWAVHDTKGVDVPDVYRSLESVKVEGSTDGVNYKVLGTAKADASDVSDGEYFCTPCEFAATKIRYLKLTMTKPATKYQQMKISEVVLFGSPEERSAEATFHLVAPSSCTYLDANGKALSSIADASAITVNAYVKNHTKTDTRICVAAAVYDGSGLMKDIVYTDTQTATKSSRTKFVLNFTGLTGLTADSHVEVYVWDSLVNGKALSTKRSFR